MTSAESFDKNATTVDGIRFETIVLERVLTIPVERPEPDGYTRTPVQLGIRITNNTPNPFRFNLYNGLTPEILGADGRAVRSVFLRIRRRKPREACFPLVLPFKNATFFPAVQLVWSEKRNNLNLSITKDSGGRWNFDVFKLGTYRVRFEYTNQRAAQTIHNQGDKYRDTKVLEHFWTGTVFTPFLEFKRF